MNGKELGLVSIIVPVYENEKEIGPCLSAILQQSYKNIQIIVINDGSRDHTQKICEKYQESDSRIEIFYKENEGAGAARNDGLNVARGEFICFIDADDLVSEKYVEKLVDAVEQFDMAICYFDDKKNEKLFWNEKISCNRDEIYCRMLNPYYQSDLRCYGYLWNKIFRRELIERNNIRFENKYKMWEDMLFCCKYVEKIHSACVIKDVLYFYNRNNEKSISHVLNFETMEVWDETAEEVNEIVKKLNLEEKLNYKDVLCDLYMKTLIYAIKEKKVKDMRQDREHFIKINFSKMRKKYKIIFQLYKCFPKRIEFIAPFLKI